MKLLVLTSEPITAAQLRDAVVAEVDPADTEVMVVAPAYQDSPLKFWLSDADEAIARAEQTRRGTVESLDAAGIPVGGETGESDPVQAITDALQTFRAERIVIFMHATEDARQYREEIDQAELEDRFGLPVVRASVSS